MSIPIGFTADPAVRTETEPQNVPAVTEARPSLVEVYFADRDAAYAYYNDRYDLQVGDLVFVEGKLEGVRGRVTRVNYAFKIKLSDYKRVIFRADTHIEGRLTLAGSHFLTDAPEVLSFETVQGWLMPPPDVSDVVAGNGDKPFPLEQLSQSGISPAVAERGRDYYARGWVACVEKIGDRVRALVQGSRPYTVEFNLQDGMVSDLVCDCYCTARCKHQVAALLQVQESLDLAEQNGLDTVDYLLAVNKHLVYEMVLDPAQGGTITFG